ncbi:isoprenylcysteine carboxylmethyltransferase family protein [Methylococcus sp. Mc7]|uniref:methyltransferase family protein n=1 Tax=Methylococcus sp. Mc7 TaxID=2860258 RepID=UPI001C52B817|nr:methyltransferase [Methylococcus sp. Mc7]QXP82914.1 DUF1295 domain-containing protein [Methylococcus sp. Mc7]
MTAMPLFDPSGDHANRLVPAGWLFYLAIGLEILFMISPAAGYFYALYGPALNLLDRWAVTAWLTQFFLPHISTTRSAVLNALPCIGGFCVLVGAAWFLIAAAQLYWSKFRRLGPVTTGLYRLSRHPQYCGLALLGLGALLLWPRFLALIAYVLMLFLYRFLAAAEERRCEQRFGDSYRDYRTRTRITWPLASAGTEPAKEAAVPGSPWRVRSQAGLTMIAVVVSVVVAVGLREYTLSQLSAHYDKHTAVLSPAPLDGELLAAYRAAVEDGRVRQLLADAGTNPLLVHVLPEDWHLADLPMETGSEHGGHDTPADFDRRRYKLLFSRARTHLPESVGKAIVRSAYGIDPLILVRVDIEARRVTAVEKPPTHVRWGDIPSPLF